jgi:alpha-methylacyl-CoA racemase
MVDGTATLMGMFWGLSASGIHDPSRRGASMLDTGAHFYDTYQCSDGEWVSLGSIEPQFYAELLDKLGLGDDEQFTRQMDRSLWPDLKDRLRQIFATRTRDEWCALMEHTDICFAPVLTMAEAAVHPHNVERGTFCEVSGLTQPAPAPRFSRTVPAAPGPAAYPGQHTRDVLIDWGIAGDRADAVIASGGARQA